MLVVWRVQSIIQTNAYHVLCGLGRWFGSELYANTLIGE
jgi:hypothetical protein